MTTPTPDAPAKGDRPTTGIRAQVRRTRGGALALKIVIFVVGLAFIALGAVAVVLPGPLTIPPILVGVLIWSTEFEWAERLRDRALESATDAWEQAKRRPVISTIITVGGLVAAGVAFWAVVHFELVGKAKDAVGL